MSEIAELLPSRVVCTKNSSWIPKCRADAATSGAYRMRTSPSVSLKREPVSAATWSRASSKMFTTSFRKCSLKATWVAGSCPWHWTKIPSLCLKKARMSHRAKWLTGMTTRHIGFCRRISLRSIWVFSWPLDSNRAVFRKIYMENPI